MREKNIICIVQALAHLKRIDVDPLSYLMAIEYIDGKLWVCAGNGIGVVEVILILVVLIGLVLIFKSQITALVNDIFDTITEQAGTV